jgi:hypothetical protein
MVSAPVSRTAPVTLRDLTVAIRQSWSLETCDPSDRLAWSDANPSRGQCAVTSLVVHDFLGGELLEAEVHNPDGSRQGFHYWNRLDGIEVDLTRDQFTDDEVVQLPRLIDRKNGGPWLAHEQYLLFRERVLATLNPPTSV